MTHPTPSPQQLAILASAYNVCGPRGGMYAKPSTVLMMATPAELARMAYSYIDAAANDPDALYSGTQIAEACNSVGGVL